MNDFLECPASKVVSPHEEAVRLRPVPKIFLAPDLFYPN